MRYIPIIGLLLLAPVVSYAQAPLLRYSDFRNGASTTAQNILEGVALNATAATRTVTLDTDGFAGLRVLVFYTYSAATTVTAQATCTYDGTNYVRITSRATSAGAGTLSLFADTYTTGAADADFSIEYGVAGCKRVKVLFGGASADGSDLVDVQAVAYVGG